MAHRWAATLAATLVTTWLALGPTAHPLQAQDADLHPHSTWNPLLDRLDILGVADTAMATGFRPYPREWAATWLARAASHPKLHPQDAAWVRRARFLLDDTVPPARKPWLKVLYPNRRDLLAYTRPMGAAGTFRLYVNPILHVGVGLDQPAHAGAASRLLYRNTRGASLRARLGRYVGAYLAVTDNQARLPTALDSVRAATGALPGAGFVKPFGNGGVDHFAFTGYITATPWRHLRLKLGMDRAHLGHGHQSLLLSDHAVDHLLFNATLVFDKLEYAYQISQFVDFIPNKPDAYGTHPRKWGVFHRLTYRPDQRVAISLYEAVVYGSQSPTGSRGFELQYLNPLMFFRALEQYLGGADNALLGAQVKANLLRRVQLHGQLMLDDWNFGVRDEGNGWFGNKIGYQLGAKWVDAFWVPTLDLGLELNRLRPYTYSHTNLANSFTHYGQPLAHARGANLMDVSVSATWRPWKALWLQGRYTYTQQGLDTAGYHYGANPFRSDLERRVDRPDQNFGHTVGQGAPLNLHVVHGRASYQLWKWDAWADLEAMLRHDGAGTELWFTAGLRLNVAQQPWRF